MTNSMKLLSIFVISIVGMIITAIFVPASLAGGIISGIMSFGIITLICIGLFG